MGIHYLHLAFSDDDVAGAAVSLGTFEDPRTKRTCPTVYDMCNAAVSWYVIRPGSSSLSAVVLAQASANSAQYDLIVAQAPNIEGWLDFQLTSTTPSSITAGSTGTCVVTTTFDSGYSDTITFSSAELLPLPDAVPQGFTATFSPTTISSSGATSTATIAVPLATPTGSYSIALIGTDTHGVSNRVRVNFTVV